MEASQKLSNVQRVVVSVVTVCCSIVVWYGLLAHGENLDKIWNFGTPLTYRRIFTSGLVRFFPGALAYDLMIAVLATAASGYSTFLWSEFWSRRNYATYVPGAICFTGIVLIFPVIQSFLGFGIESTLLAIPMLFVLLVVLPAAWFICLAYASWEIGERLLGKNQGVFFSFATGLLLLGLGVWCYPHDVFYRRGRSDVPELRSYLSDENPKIRSMAISCLRGLGPYDEVTGLAILKAMSDPDERVRSNALSLASDLGPLRVKAVPILLEQFNKHDGGTFELSQMGPVAKEAVPALKEKLPSSEGYSKLGICEALWKIEENTKLVVPALIELLDHEFGPIRVDAAERLGKIGPAAKEAVPHLKKMIEYQPPPEEPVTEEPHSKQPTLGRMSEAEFYPQIRQAAKEALSRIQGEERGGVN